MGYTAITWSRQAEKRAGNGLMPPHSRALLDTQSRREPFWRGQNTRTVNAPWRASAEPSTNARIGDETGPTLQWPAGEPASPRYDAISSNVVEDVRCQTSTRDDAAISRA